MRVHRGLDLVDMAIVAAIMGVVATLPLPASAKEAAAYKQINIEKEVEVADKPGEVSVGKLEAGEIYDVRVTARNTTGQPFTPKKAVATCSCIVGIIPDHQIDNGKLGSFLFRIRTSSAKSSLYQQVSIHGDGGMAEKEAIWK